jgi:uncharacterized RDD family membrane protein YckC
MDTELTHENIRASWARRILAFLIDFFLMSFLAGYLVLFILGPDILDFNKYDKMHTLAILILLPFFLLYFSKDMVEGISFGKWVLGIMIRNESDNKIPSYLKLFLRNLFIIIWPIELLVLVFNKDNKRLGDMRTNTLVYLNPDKSNKGYRITVPIVCVIMFVLLFKSTGDLIMKKSDAYEAAVIHIKNNENIISKTGGIRDYVMTQASMSFNNGYGDALYKIKIIGEDNNINLTVFLEKEPDSEWIVMRIK